MTQSTEDDAAFRALKDLFEEGKRLADGGEEDRARKRYVRALSLLESAGKDRPPERRRLDLEAELFEAMAFLEFHAEQLSKTVEYLKQAMIIREDLAPDEYRTGIVANNLGTFMVLAGDPEG